MESEVVKAQAFELYQRMMAMAPEDLLIRIRLAKMAHPVNEHIVEVLTLAYEEVCKKKLTEALG